jgi:hypothetical protein
MSHVRVVQFQRGFGILGHRCPFLSLLSVCSSFASMVDIAADVQMDSTINLNNTGASSLASSDSGSDSDAVNTASARVYFGPFQSPEKKLIRGTNPTASRRRTLGSGTSASPLRRSARFPSPVAHSPSRNDVEENVDNSDTNDDSDDVGEDVSPSRSGTPDNIRFPQDGMPHYQFAVCLY